MIKKDFFFFVGGGGGGGCLSNDIVLFVHTPLISTMVFFFGVFFWSSP